MIHVRPIEIPGDVAIGAMVELANARDPSISAADGFMGAVCSR